MSVGAADSCRAVYAVLLREPPYAIAATPLLMLRCRRCSLLTCYACYDVAAMLIDCRLSRLMLDRCQMLAMLRFDA